MGAVSMPLSIGLDALLLQKDVGLFICRIALGNQMVLYAACSLSLYHLTLIAWERYVVITKPCINYKLIVTRRRLKWLVGIAWLLCLLTTTPARLLNAFNVDYEYVKILELISCLPSLICIVLIGYFYVMVYLGVRQRKVNDISQQEVVFQARIARREHGIAKKVFLVTVVLLTCHVPSFVVLLFGGGLPFLRTSPYFRSTQLLTQLNSLVNPIVYCFVLKRFRKAVLEMLKFRKPAGVQQLTAGKERRRRGVRRVRPAEDLENLSEFQGGQHEDFSTWVKSCSDLNPLEPVVERSATNSACEVSQIIHVDIHQPKPRRTHRSK